MTHPDHIHDLGIVYGTDKYGRPHATHRVCSDCGEARAMSGGQLPTPRKFRRENHLPMEGSLSRPVNRRARRAAGHRGPLEVRK